MKCQHCGKNEATIYYKSTVNGRTTEARVCPACAGELGYDRALHAMERRSRRMFRDPFSLLSDPFFDGFASHLLTEFPAPGNTLEEAKAEQKEEGVLSEAESRSFDLQRRRNALQHALRDAIDMENYEEAARLRDEIRALPNE
ncbi:MAG: UvrB/UvrC motif-containing protein [Oscillospiraceae bacterium]|nr:UvrB/UvrC motif-containing protein [Oscillospiraceae bacterium]